MATVQTAYAVLAIAWSSIHCTKPLSALVCVLEHQGASAQARDMKKRRAVRTAIVPVERVARRIVRLRGHNVLFDAVLATLYGVDTRELVQAVKRNAERFPSDFMFQLTPGEVVRLRSQTVISNTAHGGRRTAPYAFTEQGVAMLSSVLRSPRAVQVNIGIMRAFVQIRQMLRSNADLARKLDALEVKYDGQFEVVFEAIREIVAPPPVSKRRIGFGP